MINSRRSLFLLTILSVIFSTAWANSTRDTALIVTETEQEWLGDWYENSYRLKTYSGYDDQNRLIYTKSDWGDGLAGPYSEIWSYEGNRTTQLFISWNMHTSAISHYSKEETFHFPQGDSIVGYRPKDDDWEYMWSTVNEYDLKGRLLEVRSDRYGDTINIKYLYEFTSSGLVASVTTQKYVDSTAEWVTDTIKYFSYNSTGNITQERKLSNRDSLKKETFYYYSESIPNRIEKKVMYNYQSNKLRWGQTELYEYDSKGNLSIVTIQHCGTADSVWTNDRRNIYTYAYYQKPTGLMAVYAKKQSEVKVRETRNEISLSGLLNGKAPVMCHVFDMKGRVVFSKLVQLSGGEIFISKKSLTMPRQTIMMQIKNADGKVLWRGKIRSFQ